MNPVWLSAKATLAHVLAHEILPDVAEAKLRKVLAKGVLPARASSLTVNGTKSTDALVPSTFWGWAGKSPSGGGLHFTVDYDKGIATSKKMGYAGNPPPVLTDQLATGVEFSARHLFEHWPALGAVTTAATTSTPDGAKKRGPKATTIERVIVEMRAFQAADLDTMTEEAMAAQFDASRDTVRKARRAVLAK